MATPFSTRRFIEDPAIIKQAYEELLKLRPNVLSFNSDNQLWIYI